MSAITKERAKLVHEHLTVHPIEETMKVFNLNYETVKRYERLNKKYIREDWGKDNNMPKILMLDIETIPMKVFVWGLFAHKNGIPIDCIDEDWCILSWAAKWLHSNEMIEDILTPEEAVKRDDRRIVLGIWQLINNADIIVAHNGDAFDLRKINSRCYIHKIPPPTPYRSVDTLKHSRRNFAHTSHKLDWLGLITSNKKKIRTDYGLWLRCMKGEVSALDEMAKYGRRDVVLLEEVYIEMRPWMKSHPNMGLYGNIEGNQCTNCGSTNITWGKGFYYTPAGKYSAYRCECGCWGRSRIGTINKEQRAELLISIAR